MLWVLTHSPLAGVRETARLFQTFDEADAAARLLHEMGVERTHIEQAAVGLDGVGRMDAFGRHVPIEDDDDGPHSIPVTSVYDQDGDMDWDFPECPDMVREHMGGSCRHLFTDVVLARLGTRSIWAIECCTCHTQVSEMVHRIDGTVEAF